MTDSDLVLPTLQKTIFIDIDSTTIKKDIQLLLTFEDMASGAKFENVAWRIADIIYDPEVIQSVPIEFQATLAFSLASKRDGKYISPTATIPMSFEDKVDIVMAGSQTTFRNRAPAVDLETNQIRADNKSERPQGVSIGFFNGKVNESAGFIPDLGHNNDWIATYKPEMKLYITSDAKQGQTIGTISKSKMVHVWNMASVAVPDQSRGFLKMEDSGEYKIIENRMKK